MKKFSIIAGILFYSSISFSDSIKTFPTPEGFTTDRSKALKTVIYFSPSIEKKIKSHTHMGLIVGGLGFCQSLAIKLQG